MKFNIKKHKHWIIILTILALAIIAYGVSYFAIILSYKKDIQLPDAIEAQIDVKHYDSKTHFSIKDTKVKQKLLDLMINKMEFKRLRIVDYPFDSEHNTYCITIFSCGYYLHVYVSNEDPDNCFVAGEKFDYYITGGDALADCLDEYMNTVF